MTPYPTLLSPVKKIELPVMANQIVQNKAVSSDKYLQLYLEFVEKASHDLQSPLRKLEVFTEKLLQSCEVNGTGNRQEYADRVRAALAQMKSLVADFTELALSCQANLRFSETDLGELVNKVIAYSGFTVKEPKPEIEIESLPVIKADAGQMETVFRKLLENSIKFKSPYQNLKINISSEELSQVERERLKLQPGIYHKIRFTDNGIGFDDADRKKIFEPLVRLHGKSQYPGNGLGLALVTRIIVNHGGTVFAEGSRSEGARIYIVLPENQD